MLDHCPGNGKSVKGTGSSSDFVQDQKTSGSGVSQNIGNLCHFYHKGTLTAGKVIRSSYSGKDPVHNSDICLVCRNKASDLSHKNDQGCLAHIGGFTCHIGTCNNGYPLFLIVKISVIGNKHIMLDHLLHNRMSAVFYIQNTAFIDLGAHIVISLGNQGKGCKNIKGGNCLGSFLNTHNLCSYLVSHLTEKLIFQSIKLIFCPQDQIFQIL